MSLAIVVLLCSIYIYRCRATASLLPEPCLCSAGRYRATASLPPKPCLYSAGLYWVRAFLLPEPPLWSADPYWVKALLLPEPCLYSAGRYRARALLLPEPCLYSSAVRRGGHCNGPQHLFSEWRGGYLAEGTAPIYLQPHLFCMVSTYWVRFNFVTCLQYHTCRACLIASGVVLRDNFFPRCVMDLKTLPVVLAVLPVKLAVLGVLCKV